MIDVRVRNHNCGDFQMMALDRFQDARGVIARVDDDGFSSMRISSNVAITVEHPDRETIVDEVCGTRDMSKYNIMRDSHCWVSVCVFLGMHRKEQKRLPHHFLLTRTK